MGHLLLSAVAPAEELELAGLFLATEPALTIPGCGNPDLGTFRL